MLEGVQKYENINRITYKTFLEMRETLEKVSRNKRNIEKVSRIGKNNIFLVFRNLLQFAADKE